MKMMALGLVALGALMFIGFGFTRVMALLIIGLILDACGCVLLVQTAKR